jgi:ABC-type sugar transport system permease subunit
MTRVTHKHGEGALLNYLYILPAALFIGVFFISSVAVTVYTSFFEWDGFSSMTFTGFENYRIMFRDPNFITSVKNTCIWVACSLVLSVLIPLIFFFNITATTVISYLS